MKMVGIVRGRNDVMYPYDLTSDPRDKVSLFIKPTQQRLCTTESFLLMTYQDFLAMCSALEWLTNQYEIFWAFLGIFAVIMHGLKMLSDVI